MTVYFNKKRGKWLYDFWRNGERHTGYCLSANGEFVKTKRAAEQAEAVEIRRIETAPKTARADELTLAQVVADLSLEWQGKPDWTAKAQHLREFLSYFGPETAIAAINDVTLERYRAWALEQPVEIWAGGPKRNPAASENERYWHKLDRKRSIGTVNRRLPTLRAILSRAHKTRDPITQQRAIDHIPKIGSLPKLKRKARPIPDLVLTEVLGILPAHISEALTATLYFGFRSQEIFGLQIPDIDFDLGGVWLRAEDVKDKEDAFLPGGPEAMAFMRRLVDQARSRGVSYLITWRPYRKDADAQDREMWRPLKRAKKAWSTAMAAIEKSYGRKYRWHDIRAAFITHVALKSGPVVAQELARHSDFRTTQAYILVSDEAQRAAATTISQRPALAVANAQSQTAIPNAGHRRFGRES